MNIFLFIYDEFKFDSSHGWVWMTSSFDKAWSNISQIILQAYCNVILFIYLFKPYNGTNRPQLYLGVVEFITQLKQKTKKQKEFITQHSCVVVLPVVDQIQENSLCAHYFIYRQE